MGVRDKPKAKASKKLVCQDATSEEPEARLKSKLKKASKKVTLKGGAGKITEKCGAAKRVKIGTSDAVKLVELAKQGSCSHAKTLLEMTGAKHMFDGEGKTQDGSESWAKLVLARLDQAESAGVGSENLQEGAQELATERS